LKKRYRRLIAILAAAAVLLVGMMGYFTVTNHQKINTITEKLNQLEESKSSNSTNGNDRLARVDKRDDSTGIPKGKENNERAAVNYDRKVDIDAMRQEDSQDLGYKESLSTVKTENFDKSVTIGRADRYILAQNTFLYTDYNPLTEDKQISTFRRTPNARTANSYSASALAEEAGSSQNVESEAMPRKRSSFTLGLMFSPDMSTAGGMSNFDNPGFKGGVLAEYSFSDRFSVRSGAIFSNVRYTAGQNDYRAPDYWNFGVNPDETSALCLILDIPVTLKATMFQFDQSNFYVTGGVSTYVMLSEEYQFDFGENDSPYLNDEWQGQTGDRFWASNLSFSIGYEMDISERIALRAEPHIYVPIREVGWGNVKLYSMGTSVSLNVRM